MIQLYIVCLNYLTTIYRFIKKSHRKIYIILILIINTINKKNPKMKDKKETLREAEEEIHNIPRLHIYKKRNNGIYVIYDCNNGSMIPGVQLKKLIKLSKNKNLNYYVTNKDNKTLFRIHY